MPAFVDTGIYESMLSVLKQKPAGHPNVKKGGRKSEKENFRSSNGSCFDVVYGCVWGNADRW